MDVVSLLSLVFGTVLSIAALAVSIYGLEEGRRATLIGTARNWFAKAFVLVVLANSALGIFLFGTSAAPITRASVLMVIVHFLNVAGVAFIIFLDATAKALEERAKKRAALESAVDALTARVAELTAGETAK